MEQSNKFSNGSLKTRKVVFIILGVLTALVILGLVIMGFVSPGARRRQSRNAETDGEAIESASMGNSYIVMEATTGRTLDGYRINAKMEPASTTKILTAICVLENMNLDDVVEVPKQATYAEGSSIYLKEGEMWKVEDLLYGLMLRSGNDSAETLAYSLGGIENFARLMNLTAIKAGAYNSNFVNPHGLHDENHYTTAYDLAKITAYAYTNDDFVKIVSTQKHYYDYCGERRCFLNKNKLLSVYEGANGVKTGYTKDSGRCLVTGAKRDNMQLISVVLNEPDMWQKSANILDNAFSKYKLVRILSTEDLKQVSIKDEIVNIHTDKDLYYPLSEEEAQKVEIEYNIRNNIKKLKSHIEVGSVFIKLQNRLIFNEKVYTI